MAIPDPNEIWPKLEELGEEEVRKRLAMGVYAKNKLPVIEEWLRRNDQKESGIQIDAKARDREDDEPRALTGEPPTILQHLKWFKEHGWDHKWYVLAALAVAVIIWLLANFSSDLAKIITGQDDGSQPTSPSVAKLSIREGNAEREEGDSGTANFTFVVTRRGSLTGTTSVRYAVFGGAVNADDFGGRMPSGEITIGDGQEQGLIEIPVSGDRDEEPDEDFTVGLSHPIPDNTVIVAQTARGIILNDDASAPQTSPPPRDDKGAPVTGLPETANAMGRNGSRPVYDAISLVDIKDPERSEVPFPSGYFRSRLAQELGTDSTMISHIRVGLAFIEPYERRRQAVGGTITGYILVSLPRLANCTRKFGPQAYSFADATTGIMKAINDYISEIADWIRRASLGEKLTCPTD